MFRSIPARTAAVLVLAAVPLTLALTAEPTTERAAAAMPFHPHFPKVLTCTLSKDLVITLRYQTVTFDKQGAEAMAVGKAWHLAGAAIETTGDLVIGGNKVAAGKYALSARKTEQGFELVLHEGRGFSTKIGDDAHVLRTDFVKDAPLYEHLNIDVQPGGDKEHTVLHLDVHFDTLMARALIEIPE